MIFPPGYLERNLKKCISVCFAAFQLYVLETSQPVSYNKQHPCLPVLKFILIIFLVILKRPFQSHSLGATQCRPKLAGNFKPADRRKSWQDGERSEWKLWAEILTTAGFLALGKVRECHRGCSPEPLGFMELGARPATRRGLPFASHLHQFMHLFA